LKFEYRYWIGDFKDNLSIHKHSKLKSTLWISRTYLFKDIRTNRVRELYFWILFVLLIGSDLRSWMFDFLNTTTSRNICLDNNHFEFLFITILCHLANNVYALRVLLYFSNELSNFLIQYLKAIYFQIAIFKEKAVVEHFLISHNMIY
jgi:hypothetical protein